MAQKDAKIKFLERELAEKEREIDSLKEIEIPPIEVPDGSPSSGISPDTNDRLNRLEAMVKGLTEEMLDIRSIVDKLWDRYEIQQKAAKSIKQESKKTNLTSSPDKKAVGKRPEAKPAAVVAQADNDEETELIMQVDGTLKREKRSSKEYIVAETSAVNIGSQNRKKAGTIIYAEEDDTKFVRGKKRS